MVSKGSVATTCAFCGETIFRFPCAFRNGGNHFCDRKCNGKWRSEHFAGEANPNWGNHLSEKIKQNISKANTGKTAWNKGLTKGTDERMRRSTEANSLGVKKKWKDSGYREKQEARWADPQRRIFMGKIASEANTRHWQDPAYCENYGQMMENFWADPKYREKTLKAMVKASHTKPNKAELKLFSILNEHFPGDYALNVKGEVMILGGKIPDFVNVNGKKSVIELFGDYWHKGDNPQNRINYFQRFGYNTLVIWEHELLNEPLLVQRLTRFKYVRRPKSLVSH